MPEDSINRCKIVFNACSSALGVVGTDSAATIESNIVGRLVNASCEERTCIISGRRSSIH